MVFPHNKAMLGAAGLGSGGIEFVGRKSGVGAGTGITLDLTTLAGGIDTQPREGDIVILTQAVHGFGIINYDMTVTTSGYTEEADMLVINTNTTHLGVHYKVMGSTPDTQVVTPQYNTNVAHVTIALVFRGVDTTTPLDVSTTTSSNTNTADINPPAITPVTDGSAIVVCGAASHDQGTAGSFSNLSTYDHSTVRQRNDGVYDASGLSAFLYWDGAGAYDPPVSEYSLDSTAFSSAAATLALKPA